MTKYTKYLFMLIISTFMSFTFAQTSTTLADIKTDMISTLQKDGYLSEKLANEASQKYITPSDINSKVSISLSNPNTPSTIQEANSSHSVNWTQYLSWINFIKVVACILLIIAFWGVIKMIAKSAWHIIAAVPVFIYQSIFLSLSLFATIFPEYIWVSQYFYIALIASFTNIILLGWIVSSYPIIAEILSKLFKLGIPVPAIISFWAMIYFGVLAIVYQSSVFGFFSAVGLSGIFSFSLIYFPGLLVFYFKENKLASVVFGHIIVLSLYVLTVYFNMFTSYLSYFNAGIQYYCTIALGVSLLVGSSPFYKKDQAPLYFLLFVILVSIASALYFFLSMTVIATILFIFFTLVFLEWIGYASFRTNWVLGCAISGFLLYVISLVLESYGSIILNNMKAIPS